MRRFLLLVVGCWLLLITGIGRGAVRPDSNLKGAVFSPDPAAPFAHPFYWAPFTLMGNWL
jgi:CHAT domain-containing protein